MLWTNLSSTASGEPPLGRDSFGFAAAVDGSLYVFGGCVGNSGQRPRIQYSAEHALTAPERSAQVLGST